jgi:hypothetical protein
LKLQRLFGSGVRQFFGMSVALRNGWQSTAAVRKKMKEISKLRLVEAKHKFRKNALEKSLDVNEPGELVTDLKNAMTLFYLALETLRSSLDKPAVCARRIEELKSLTGRIHAQMDKLLETFS